MNIKRKIITSILICAFVLSGLSFSHNHFAFATANSQETNLEKLIDNSSKVELYDAGNKVVANYYKLTQGGYIITNATEDDLVEFSLETNPYKLDNKKEYYYTGPNGILVKIEGNTYVNYLSKERYTVNKNDFIVDSATVKQNDEELKNDKSKDSSKDSNSGKLKHATRPYSYNPDGRCGSVAYAITLRYYNDYVNQKYVSKAYETQNGVKLINMLKKKYLGIGTDYNRLSKKGSLYLKNQKLKKKLTNTYDVASSKIYKRIKGYIKSNRPLIVGLLNHKKYGNHWVVGTGYKTVKFKKKTKYIVIVNDGWGNRNVNINMSYIDGCSGIVKAK